MNYKKTISRHFIFTAAVTLLLPLFSFAQLPQGSTAPDWTMTDINKKVWHLYDLTAKGKTVFIDVSSTWCGPCWHYHRQRSLDSLYAEHGPNGTVDQSCCVFLIEGDGSTNSNDLNGTGKKTVGNWIAGTDFPIIDPSSDTINKFMVNYHITYFPTVYMICPDNKMYLVGPGTTDVLFHNTKSGCAPVPNNPNQKNFRSGNSNSHAAANVEEAKDILFQHQESGFYRRRKIRR